MVSGSAELLAGVVQDPVFGPLVAFGPGGVLAELIGDAGFRIAPLTDLDAEDLVGSGKVGRLVRGFRGRPPADAEALTDLLHRLSRLAEELPEVVELDLNPVVALTEGCVAVDAPYSRAQARACGVRKELVAAENPHRELRESRARLSVPTEAAGQALDQSPAKQPRESS
jgi:acyl-CoA synthetase (NDP forming)